MKKALLIALTLSFLLFGFNLIWANPPADKVPFSLSDHTHPTYESDITELQSKIKDLEERLEFLESIAHFKFVFVTSKTYTGNIGGLTVADSECQALAEAAGLPGTYKAWLSDSTSGPKTRLSHSSDPYILVDGTKIADNWIDLISNYEIQNPINKTEDGTYVSDYIWTNTNPNGEIRGGNHCENWTYDTYEPGDPSHMGSVGKTTYKDYMWSAGIATPCYNKSRLYCFQQ